MGLQLLLLFEVRVAKSAEMPNFFSRLIRSQIMGPDVPRVKRFFFEVWQDKQVNIPEVMSVGEPNRT